MREGWGLSVREGLASLSGLAGNWRASVAERVSVWRRPPCQREEPGPVALFGSFSRLRGDARLQWVEWRSFLLERLAEAHRLAHSGRTNLREHGLDLYLALRTSIALWWNVLTNGVPGHYIRSRLRIWRSILRLQMLRERRKGGVWGCVRAFSRSSHVSLLRSCREFLYGDEDCQLGRDLFFLLSEHQARAAIIVLFLTFSVLLEVVAASCLGNVDTACQPCTATSTLTLVSHSDVSHALLIV